ncbi:MAG: M20/M25/M40 family metallo-hydrolase [Erysipelotrichaceae bacterium]|nr:M20/M25/M40 family metallo-hydrolase [Erysipelotrichaceae bacterium]
MILILLAVLILILLVRTLMFKPLKEEERDEVHVEFDGDEAINNLQKLVQCKTVSYYDSSLEDDDEFNKLIDLLPGLYPMVFEKLELKKFANNRALLFHWPGKNQGEAAVYMAHYDVVPVEEDLWTKPAFEGLIENGVMYGRGTLDTKLTFNGILCSCENLLRKGFVPENDIYFAFSGGEEVSGPGAKMIVDYFKENDIKLSMVLDEGGAVVEDVFPGVKGQCGLVGIAEKGLMNVEFKVKSNGGHASAPGPHTPIGILSRACQRVEDNPFKPHYDAPVLKMFDTLGRRSNFLYRMIFANLWLFKPVLNALCKKQGGELNALIRTTVAFTQMSGSKAPNVVPPVASMVANLRLNPADTVDSALKYLKEVVNDTSVEINVLDGENPSDISVTDNRGYHIVKEAIEDTWKGSVVSPYLMIQCSDSRNYSGFSDKVYRFSAMDVTSEERKTIHGNDERVRLETVKRAVEFFMRCMLNN